MMADYGVGALGGVVLIDPATGLPYKAAGGGGGGGGGAVDSVNGKTGVVVLSASDVGAATTAQGAKADTAVKPAALAGKMGTETPATFWGVFAVGSEPTPPADGKVHWGFRV